MQSVAKVDINLHSLIALCKIITQGRWMFFLLKHKSGTADAKNICGHFFADESLSNEFSNTRYEQEDSSHYA